MEKASYINLSYWPLTSMTSTHDYIKAIQDSALANGVLMQSAACELDSKAVASACCSTDLLALFHDVRTKGQLNLSNAY